MSMFRSGGMRSVSKQLAHTTILPLGNKDLKPLQDLITADKFLISSFQRTSQDFGRSAEALKFWGVGEGEDLADILTNSCNILQLLAGAINQFATHEETIRTLMKAVRTREENLDELRRRRRGVGSKADAAEKKLSKMGSENKHRSMQVELLNQLRDEMRTLDTDIMVEEARIGDYKRYTTKEWMATKYGGILELGEKLTVVGNQGKLLIEEIPMDQTTPGYGRAQYVSFERAARIASDTVHRVNQIAFQPAPNVAYDVRTPHLAPPPSQELNPMHTGQYSGSAEQQHYSGLPHGPEPHAITPHYATMPHLDGSHLQQPSGNNSYNEFGQANPSPYYPELMPPDASSTGLSFPPRTTSFRTDSSGTAQDNSAGRYATFAGHSREPNSMAGSPSLNPLYNPVIGSASMLPLSPAVPPKDVPPLGHNPWNGSEDTKTSNGLSNVPRVSNESAGEPLDPNRKLSTFDDSDASMVLAYYSTQGEDTTSSPVSVAHKKSPKKDISYEGDPYADDAFHEVPHYNPYVSTKGGPSASSPPVASTLPAQATPKYEESQQANAAAARDISRELDALEFSVATGGSSPPPPRTSSRKASLPYQVYSPPNGPPSQPGAISNPPLLSLSFSDTHFDANDFPSFGSPPRTNPQASRQATLPKSNLSSPPKMQAFSADQHTTPGFSQSNTAEQDIAASRKIPMAVFDPDVIPAASPPPQPLDDGPRRMPSGLSVNTSAHSGDSQLSELHPPNPSFMNSTPAVKTTESLPSSPTGLTVPGDGTATRTISTSAFKRVKAPSPGVSPAEPSKTEPGGFEPLHITKRAQVPAMPSYGSSSTDYISAPTSPVRDLSYSDAPPSPTGAFSRPSPFAPSPLSTPLNARSVGSHESSSNGAYGQQQLPVYQRREPPPELSSDYHADPGEIGVAKGSPSSPSHPVDSYYGFGNLGPHRMTIGESGWKPMLGAGSMGRNGPPGQGEDPYQYQRDFEQRRNGPPGQGEDPYQYQREFEQRRDGDRPAYGAQPGGYNSGRYTTNLE